MCIRDRPGSILIYGSNFWIVTRYPRAFSRQATDEEIIPLPSEDTTPPVTKIYFVSTRIGFYYFQTAKIAIIFQKTKNTPIHYLL